jgi:hypothetical protein
MTDEPAAIPVSATLEAKVIRRCEVHKDCPLDCPERQVQDLGQIASFRVEETRHPSLLDRIFKRGDN